MSENNKPVQKIQYGSIKASIWENKGEKDGKNYSFHTVSLQRGYKQKDEWKNTDSLRRSDLYDAIKCLEEAHTYLNEQARKKAEDSK